MDVWKEPMIPDEFLFEGSTTEPLLAPWAWSNFIYKDVIQLWKMAVTSSFCFSPCALELEWFGFSVGLQGFQEIFQRMLFWMSLQQTRSKMTKMGQSECPTLVLQSSLPIASFLQAMWLARARAFPAAWLVQIQLRCLWMIYLNLMLHGALRQCWLSFIQCVCAEDLQQLRWNYSSCMRSDFKWMLVSLETSQLDCQQLSWPGTWQTFQVMRSLQTMAKAGFSCTTPWMRSSMQWRWVKDLQML